MYLQFPLTRMRRMRRDGFSRQFNKENRLHAENLVYPVFVVEGNSKSIPINSLPGLARISLDNLLPIAEQCLKLNIPAIALFPVIETCKKTDDGINAVDPNGLIPRTIRQLKQHFPELGIITDIALDPYTTHGHDGVIDNSGYVLNDQTVDILCQQALAYAAAGSDVVAPSDMMDGRIGAIRKTLESNGHIHTRIMAYAAKYNSGFYEPFREAVCSKDALQKNNLCMQSGANFLSNQDGKRNIFSGKSNYQMDPANSDEAIREVALDIQEGADMVMVKPGLPYLDILRRVKDTFSCPTFAYQVSGEYAMVKSASAMGFLDEATVVLETLLCLRRAGANGIFSYFALDAARYLQDRAE